MMVYKEELVKYLKESLRDINCCAFDYQNDDRRKLSKIISDITNTLKECMVLNSLDDYYKSHIELMYGNIQSTQSEELNSLMSVKFNSSESKKNEKMNAVKNQMGKYIRQIT